MIDALEHSAVLRLAETTMEPCRPGFTRAIIRTPQMMSVVIDIIGGPWAEADPMHAHPHEQVTYVAAGEILFVSGDQPPQRLSTGDMFAIPPNVPHSIQLLSETARLVDSFHPGREDFIPAG